MSLLSLTFGSLVSARNHLYDRGILPIRKLQGPVVSVGNLSVGGSGKTPFVLLLGQQFQARGIKFDILSRGYRRKTRGAALVDSAGAAADFGDEPLLLARKLSVPVIVGEDRHQAGLLSERCSGPRLHILDDGFQHRALARDFDVVLVTPEDTEDRLLPTGRLREPLASLRRADVVVLAGEVSPESFSLGQRPVWHVRRGIEARQVPARPVAFCGIAKPQNFIRELRTAGIEPAAEAFYRDHHTYTESDIRDLLTLREKSGAGGFVTTEKDEVNLGPHIFALQPLSVIPVRMELVDAANAVDTMLRTIEERRRSA